MSKRKASGFHCSPGSSSARIHNNYDGHLHPIRWILWSETPGNFHGNVHSDSYKRGRLSEMDPTRTDEERTFHTVCHSHCGGKCEIKVHVKENRVIRVEPDEKEALQPRACLKGRAYRQRVYHPDRLLYPLKRTGTKGSGQFTRVSWDEALETVAREMRRVKDTYGPASILFFCSMADPHAIHHERAMHRLLCQFGGYTAPWGTISNEAQNFAAGTTYGTAYGAGQIPEDYLNSRLIIMWGWNPATTMLGTTVPTYLVLAKEAGTRIVCVDPRFTDSVATFAGQWVPIRPGTDAAALLAMAFVIISEICTTNTLWTPSRLALTNLETICLALRRGW